MKFSQVATNSAPALTDYLMGVTSANVDFRATLQNIVNVILNTSLLSNPYKFRVSRNTSVNSVGGTSVIVPMDTKQFDTSSNVDVITNKGRFTAPVSGYYQFNLSISLSSGGALAAAAVFFKNGAQYSVGEQVQPVSATGITVVATDFIQLAAGDYIEPAIFTNATTGVNPGTGTTFFSGFLQSKT